MFPRRWTNLKESKEEEVQDGPCSPARTSHTMRSLTIGAKCLLHAFLYCSMSLPRTRKGQILAHRCDCTLRLT